jgi:hypothetical protein
MSHLGNVYPEHPRVILLVDKLRSRNMEDIDDKDPTNALPLDVKTAASHKY